MMVRTNRICAIALLASVLVMAISGTAMAASSLTRVFASSADAADALVVAAAADDQGQAVLSVLGADDMDWIFSGDPVHDRKVRDRFIEAFLEKHTISMQSADQAVLLIGHDDFPFPFPIVRSAAGWSFAPELGKEEVLNRRIGKNELEAIQVLLAVVDAQREYASVARDGSALRQYAPRFHSSPGKRDGLYWPASDGEQDSPLGPLVAEAARAGYTGRQQNGSEGASYKGYIYRLLTGQGPNASGGAYNYRVDGKMIGGFAVVASPSRYGVTGIKSFIVNHDGVLYESDLGPGTARRFGAMRVFDPDRRWQRVDEAHTAPAEQP